MKISNPDGTCSLNSSLEMMATEDINFSMFLCLVQHDSQSPVNEMSMLFITEQLERSQLRLHVFLLQRDFHCALHSVRDALLCIRIQDVRLGS
ncbi:hypothetical protein E2320_022802, partial [Naja naja]